MGNPIYPNLLEKKESFYVRQRFNSNRTILAGLGHQYGRRYIVRDEEIRGPGHSAVSVCPDTSFHPAPDHKSAERYVPTLKYIIISRS